MRSPLFQHHLSFKGVAVANRGIKSERERGIKYGGSSRVVVFFVCLL